MPRKYPVVTLCGSTRFKEEFEKVQKDLTLAGNAVISVGLFGHAGDNEVWENMPEDTLTRTKRMLDDMHKQKIDMADSIFVVNPNGYIGESTWSEICYAFMTGKKIDAMFPIDQYEIRSVVEDHIRTAEKWAILQLDSAGHSNGYIDQDNFTWFDFKGQSIFDPWLLPDHQNIFTYFNNHNDPEMATNPVKTYGKKNFAWFVEDLLFVRGGLKRAKRGLSPEMFNEESLCKTMPIKV